MAAHESVYIRKDHRWLLKGWRIVRTLDLALPQLLGVHLYLILLDRDHINFRGLASAASVAAASVSAAAYSNNTVIAASA